MSGLHKEIGRYASVHGQVDVRIIVLVPDGLALNCCGLMPA